MLSLICAVAENYAIGHNNQLLYPLRDDLRRFKALTTGHTILMGRRTFESLPKGALPNRRNIVISTTQTEAWPRTEVYDNLEAALSHCSPEEEIFVIGGAQLYAATLHKADRLYLTHVHATPNKADAFFPTFNPEEWEVAARQHHPTDEHHSQAFTFVDYRRK